MKWIVLLITLLLAACNSQQSKLSSIGGIDSSQPSNSPFITNVTVPPATIYGAGSDLDFTVSFSKPVTVDGIPRITFQTDDGIRHALYQAGTGTSVLQFKYTVSADILDDNGIILSQAIDLNGGSIYDAIDNEDALLTFSYVPTWGIMINSRDSALVSITPPANGTYSPGQTLRFIATFNSRVCGTGTPRLMLNIGGNTRYAVRSPEACATTMKFDYVVQAGETDGNGIQLSGTNIDVSIIPSSIKDSFGDSAVLSYSAATYASVLVGSVAPVEWPRTPPVDDTYAIGEHIEFILNFDKPVFVTGGTPDIHIVVGGNVRSAFYLGGSSTQSLVFRYTVVEGDLDTDGITVSGFQYNGSSISDVDGNNAPLGQSWPSLANVKVDGVRPVISTIGTPANGIYRPAGFIDFVVTWSEHVNFQAPFPHLAITLDSSPAMKQATSHTNNGLVTTYRYTIQNGDADFNGISIIANILSLPAGGAVTDDAGNSATLTFPPQTTSGILVAPYGVEHWYDPTNYGTFGTSSGTTLNQFLDLIEDFNGIITGSLGWNGAPKRVDFVSGTNSLTFTSNFTNFSHVYLVLTTKGISPGSIMYDGIGTDVALNIGGTMSVGANCGSCAQYYNGFSWIQTTAGTGNFGSAGLNQKKIIMLKYNGQANVDLNLNAFNGWYLNELFILNGPSVETYSAEFYRALSSKHSTATLP